MKKILLCSMLAATSVFAQRYEAEAAELGPAIPPDQYNANPQVGSVATHASASGGSYVVMKNSDKLAFTINVAATGFYQVTAKYSNTYGDSKQQNIYVNGSSLGSVVFAPTGTSVTFQDITLASKVNLNNGVNTFEIRHNWGWVDIDYIEVKPYEEESFNISATLVTPNPSANAQKMYDFLRENFTKKVISGVMTGYDLQTGYEPSKPNDEPYTIYTVPEMKQAADKSNGKYPALLGLDFLMGTGKDFEDGGGVAGNAWGYQYTKGVLNLAEELYSAGGIPHLMWHWRDPTKSTNAFYTIGSGNGQPETSFDFKQAFSGSGYTTWNTSSSIYNNIIADIDIVAGYLKTLAEKNIPVLWRPLHEAAGAWFWWGLDKQPQATKSLWILMFDRMVNHHGLDNLIWVWTCEEGADALQWYPGDQYVDIIGRDIYHWPDAENKQEYGSLVSNFENLKALYNANKIIALSENGSIPDPDELEADGAGWSFFMSWNGNFLSNANSNVHWNKVMNHDYVLTLDEMPGWDNVVPVLPGKQAAPQINLRTLDFSTAKVYDLRGNRVSASSFENLKALPAGVYVVKTPTGRAIYTSR